MGIIQFLLVLAGFSWASEKVQVTDQQNQRTAELPPVVRIVNEQLSFSYMSNDGGVYLNCVHSRIRDLPDWEVVCGKGTNMEKQFAAHFIAREFPRGQGQTVIEVLYWVTERNQTPRAYNATSFWMTLTSKTSLQNIRLHQGVENDSANLMLEYTP